MFVGRLVPLIALVGAFVFPLSAGAQSAGAQSAASPAPQALAPDAASHRGHHGQRTLFRALRTLNLTPAQQQQIAEFRAQEKSANVNADSATQRANARKMRQQIMGVLTPDQTTQLTAAMHHLRAKPPSSAPTTSDPAAPAPSPASN